MDLVVTFVGIITLVCGGMNPDPCTGPFPMKLTAYLPKDTSAGVCVGAGNGHKVPKHKGYVRLSGKPPGSGTSWPDAIKCGNDNDVCNLYPLASGKVSISGVTGGKGVSSYPPPSEIEEIRWKSYHPGLMITATPERSAAAWLSVGAGNVKLVQAPAGMISTEVTVPGGSNAPVVVSSGPWKLVVPAGGKIDILNLPEKFARGKSGEQGDQHAHASDENHFFLHYALAAKPPSAKCCGPTSKAPYCAKSKSESVQIKSSMETTNSLEIRGATLACSNSNWP